MKKGFILLELIIVIILLSLCIQTLSYRPVYYWNNPNIIIKTIKITDKIGLLHYKNYEKDKERLGLYYQIKF